jgi:3-deoxy-D-manno-octulosonate 8-phosphate phosphatase KdsC-like HAD superfamily phosphatase
MTSVTPVSLLWFAPMASWRTERRLAQVAVRLRALRNELAIVDEQLAQLGDDADDLALRALVSETPAASFESNDARKHVDAMRRHREHVVAEIAELEVRQDELLDRMTS